MATVEEQERAGREDPRAMLVVLPTWVGDFVMATPALRALRDRFVRTHITFVLEPNLRDLVRGGDWMDDCIEWPMRDERAPYHRAFREFVRELRRRRFDWSVVMPNSFRAALLTRLAGAKRRFAYNRDGRGFLLTDRVPVRNRRRRGRTAGLTPRGAPIGDASSTGTGDGKAGTATSSGRPAPTVASGKFIPTPLVEYFADLVEAIGCDRPGDRLELFTSLHFDDMVEARLAGLGVEENQPLVVISPGAKYGAAKCWFPERFAGVADRLIEATQAAVVITCGPGEEELGRTIGSSMKRTGFVFDAPLLGLGGLKSLIRRSDLLVCNDAGPRHFAKAFNVPVVTVFGPTDPEWTATRYARERIVRIDIECGPCQQRICPLGHLDCMGGVTVDAVFQAAVGLLHADAMAESRESSGG